MIVENLNAKLNYINVKINCKRLNMKLGQLLEEVKVGTENYKNQKTAKEIVESFDEDINTYKISSLLNVMVSKLTEGINEDNASVIRSLRKIQNKIEMYEEKVKDNGFVSPAYARMKYDSLIEDYNYLATQVVKNKIQRQLNKEAFAHSVALIRYQIESIAPEANIDEVSGLKNLPETFEPLVAKEHRLIQESIE